MPDKNNFRFIDFKVKALHFKANEDYVTPKSNMVEFTTDINLSTHYDRKTKMLAVEFGLTQLKEETPFTFDVHAVGLFQFDKNVKKEQFIKLSTINCPAIMFPYIREVVADISRRGGFPPLHLTPINFVKLAEKSGSAPTVKD